MSTIATLDFAGLQAHAYCERGSNPHVRLGWRGLPVTSPSKRDIEPAVHFHSKKELPLLPSEN
jgi:hypothetical protein